VAVAEGQKTVAALTPARVRQRVRQHVEIFVGSIHEIADWIDQDGPVPRSATEGGSRSSVLLNRSGKKFLRITQSVDATTGKIPSSRRIFFRRYLEGRRQL